MSQLLALTATNRQIRAGTLYLFANLDTFVFACATHMLNILRRMPQARRDQIRSVVFFHHPGSSERRAIPELFEILVKMNRLSESKICMDPWGYQR